MSQLKKQLPFFNVAPTGIATLQLPLGPTYERIMLKLGGTTFEKSHIKRVKLRVNTRVVHECTGLELDAMNNYTGLPNDPKFLVLDFSELKARDQLGQSIGALATGPGSGVQTAMLEVEIAGATAPQLEAYTVETGPKAVMAMNKLLPYPINIGNAGKWPIVLPHADRGSLLKRAYIFGTKITELEVKVNGVTIFQADKATNEFWQRENEKQPQPGLWVFDPCVDNNFTEMLNTASAQTFEFLVTTNGSESITVYGEFVDMLENL